MISLDNENEDILWEYEWYGEDFRERNIIIDEVLSFFFMRLKLDLRDERVNFK